MAIGSDEFMHNYDARKLVSELESFSRLQAKTCQGFSISMLQGLHHGRVHAPRAKNDVDSS